MKKIILPSTFEPSRKRNNAKSVNTLDLNSIFWKYIFSEKNVRSLFNEYICIYNSPDEFKHYLDFIVDNLDITNAISDSVFSLSFDAKRSLYCFKVYFFILSIFNKVNKDYKITLPYGIFFNHTIDVIENSISDDKGIISDIFNRVLNSNRFFENNNKYIFKIHWENELYVVLLLAHVMRKKFDNIEISIDLGDVNEQADFSFWKT